MTGTDPPDLCLRTDSPNTTMQCTDCGTWLTSADLEVGEGETYCCGECGARLPPEHARTELFAWV